MAREKTIPSTSTFVQDYGLNVSPNPIVRNRSVVILGTSEDGPMYEPIALNTPEEAEYAFGRLGQGDLVRGISECWNAQSGTPNVYGVRIGNGKTAKLKIYESSGTGNNTPESSTYVALNLEAKYPGAKYNQISIGYDSDRNVVIYNPKTGVSTKISVDTVRASNPNVDVHNVQELVDFINNDRNLRSVLTASYEPIVADYEISVSGNSSALIKNDANGVQIDLGSAITLGLVASGTSAWLIQDPVNAKIAATNNLLNLQSIEAVSISTWEDLGNASKSSVVLGLNPIDGKGATWNTIRALGDYDGKGEYVNNPAASPVSEFIYSVKYALMDGGNGEGAQTNVSGLGANTFKINVPLCPDDSEESDSNKVASGIINTLVAYANYSGANWTKATCQGIDVNADAVRPSGLIKVYVSDDVDINGYWQELPYSSTDGVFVTSFVSGVATFDIGSAAGTNPVMRALVDSNGDIVEGKFIRATFNTVKGFLTEVESLPALEDNPGANTASYFLRGNEIVFDTTPAFDMIINYGTRITYEVGVNVELTDASKGIISFTDPELLPGPGGASIGYGKANAKSNIRFNYTYLPNWPAITTAVKTLTGGTNGNQLTSATRYAELDKAYANLRNFEASIWVPMGAYVDSTSERYNPVTGLKEEVPTGYHIQLEDFLDDLSINSVQPHAILGVTPVAKVTQAEKDLWVERLTVVDPTDINRAANIMLNVQNKFMSVVAFDPIVPNIGRGSPYATNGQAIYAGMLASIPYNVSPTNKEIKGIYNLRFALSTSQYEAINSSRYVTMMPKAGKNPVIVNDVTAAPYGSDFTSWSVFSITAEASDRVRNVASTYIGKANDLPTRNSLEQDISNTLLSMGGLQAFNFTVNSTINQQVLGIVEVDLVLVPIFTIKKIRTTVKLRKSIQ